MSRHKLKPEPMPTTNADPSTATVPLGTYHDLSKRHEELSKHYVELLKEHESCLARLERARQKLSADRQRIHEWQEWYDKHPKPVRQKSTITPRYLPGPLDDNTTLLPLQRASSATDFCASSDALPKLGSESEPLPLPVELDIPVTEPPNKKLSVNDDLCSSPLVYHHPSSQTTQGESDLPVPTSSKTSKVDGSSPIIVATRTLGRPRRRRCLAVDDNNSSPTGVSIKHEQSQMIELGDPVSQLARLKTMSSQVSDLDKISGHVATPRKRPTSSGLTTAPPPIPLDIADSLSDIENEPIDLAMGQVSPRDRSARQSHGPLTPMNVNTPTLPRTSSTSTAKRKRYRKMPPRWHFVTEDCGPRKKQKITSDTSATLDHSLEGRQTPVQAPVLQSRQPTARKMSPKSAKAGHDDRLDAMRRTSRTPAQKSEATSRPTTARRTTPDTNTHQGARTAKARQDKSAVGELTTLTKQVSRPESPLPIDPNHEPLRLRPVKRLNLTDFKINPAYADRNYAYVESIRTRDARRCIPGCTRPECCGQLLKFARDDEVLEGGSSSNDNNEALIRSFLGERGYASFIGSWPSSSQREDMVQRAKAQTVVDRFGKHRQIHERSRSPAGYWRTEMPSTQEMEADRVEARRRERDKVEERWRDALRGGGRWMFRDE